MTGGSVLESLRGDTPGTSADLIARRLKVLFCVDSFNLGGSELNAVRTAERLDPRRVELSVACLRTDGPLRQRYEALGIRPVHFPLSSFAHPSTLAQAYRFALFVRRHRFDIVQTHDMYSNIFAIPAARAAGSAATLACRRWWTDMPRRSHRVANRLSYRFADRVLVNSDSVGKLVESEEGVAHLKVAVIPNFVDERAFDSPDAQWLSETRRRFGLTEETIALGCVANLLPLKDHRTLLAAVADLRARRPGLRLILVGDGPCRADLEHQVQELGLFEHVVFAGRMPHEPSPHYLFDISVLTSRSEGFPNSIVEAMAAGRPIVATAVGGVPDTVVDGASGYLVPPGDASRLVQALEDLIRDPVKRSAFGAAARSAALARFRSELVIPRLHELYERLVSEHSPRGNLQVATR